MPTNWQEGMRFRSGVGKTTSDLVPDLVGASGNCALCISEIYKADQYYRTGLEDQ